MSTLSIGNPDLIDDEEDTITSSSSINNNNNNNNNNTNNNNNNRQFLSKSMPIQSPSRKNNTSNTSNNNKNNNNNNSSSNSINSLNSTNNQQQQQQQKQKHVSTSPSSPSSPTSNTDNHNNGISPLKLNLNPMTNPTIKSVDSIQHFLSTLQDEHSTYMNVSKACQFINQFGTFGSYNTTPMTTHSYSRSYSHNNNINNNITTSPNMIQSNILQLSQNTTSLYSTLYHALSNTASNHTDRRCRILSIQTLSIISYTTYFKFILTPHLYSNREQMIHLGRIQDEIINDIITSIVSCVLEDDDEGVACVAIENLGRFVLTHNNNNDDDTLRKEMDCIQGKKNPWDYGSNNNQGGKEGGGGGYTNIIQDVNYTTHVSNMQYRILESILSPRIRKIFTRTCLFKQTKHKIKSIQTINQIMIFVYKTNLVRRGKTGTQFTKDCYAKRWYEFDAKILMQEYVDLLLMPLLHLSSNDIGGSMMTHNVDMGISIAMDALKLCSTLGYQEGYVDELIQLSLKNLERGIHRMQMQQSASTRSWNRDFMCNLLSATFIALRGIPKMSRVSSLISMTEIIYLLPSTESIPRKDIALAMTLEDGSRRKPSRVGYWAEIALALLLPDTKHGQSQNIYGNTTNPKSPLKFYLESDVISKLFARSRKNSVLDASEELVYTFCSVAYVIGRRFMNRYKNKTMDDDDNCVVKSWTQHEYDSWFSNSLDILTAFLPCLSWDYNNKNSNETLMEQEVTMCYACQRSYMELMKYVLLSSGMITTNLSVFLHFILSIPTIPDSNSSSSLPSSSEDTSTTRNFQDNILIENQLSQILDDMLKLLINADVKVQSRTQRLSVLSLLSDVWIGRCKIIMNSKRVLNLDQKGQTGGGPIDIDEDVADVNELHARQLLSLLATEISLLLSDEHKRYGRNEAKTHIENAKSSESFRYLLTCISCVELMGYAAQLLANHLSESKSNIENEESARYLVSVCTVVLKGQVNMEDMASSKRNSKLSTIESTTSHITPFTSECTDAAKRLQTFLGQSDDTSEIEEKYSNFDFSCLCPLFKRPNFGADHNITKGSSANDFWNVADNLSLLSEDVSLSPSTKSLLSPQIFFMGETFQYGHILQLYRQILHQRVESALESSPLHILRSYSTSFFDSTRNSLPIAQPFRICRNLDPLHLSSAPMTPERFRSISGSNYDYSRHTFEISNGSDPLSMTLSYGLRQIVKSSNNRIEWGIVVTIVVYNRTAVPISNGVRMDAVIVQGEGNELLDEVAFTESATFKNELNPGSHFIWEFVLDSWPLGSYSIAVTCTLRELDGENSTYSKFHTPNRRDNQDSEAAKEILQSPGRVGNGLDSTVASDDYDEEGEDAIDVTLTGSPVCIQHFINLQPNPLVFYRDSIGDQLSFQFLWLSMPYHSSEITTIQADQSADLIEGDTCHALVSYSTVNIVCKEGSDEKYLTGWAFSTWSGNHLLALSDVTVTSSESTQLNLFVRSDRRELLQFFAEFQKQKFVSNLTDGKWKVL